MLLSCLLTVLATVSVGASPEALALHPDGQRLLVSERGDDTISVVDLPSATVVDVWAVTDEPTDVAIHPDGTRMYAVDSLANRGVGDSSNTSSRGPS